VRVLAIDLGLKRTGLAWTDPEQRVALPLEVVPTATLRQRLQALAPELGTFVVGYPQRLGGGPTEMTPHVEGLVRWLQHTFPDKTVLLVDERLSTVEAGRWVQQRSRRNKGTYDIASAVVILQAYLMRQKG